MELLFMKKYKNYVSNLKILEKAKQEDLTNEFILSGIIDKFFIQFELGWKVMKELLLYEGRSIGSTGSPRSIIKAAYAVWDFIDEEKWLEMLKARNDMSHMYDELAAKKLVQDILDRYIPEFQKIKNELEEQYGDMLEQQEL